MEASVMSASVIAVFETAKLLEMTLLCLPVRDLVRARRISKTFKAAIQGAPTVRLKQAIFLIDDKEANQTRWVIDTSGNVHVLHGKQPTITIDFLDQALIYVANPLFLSLRQFESRPLLQPNRAMTQTLFVLDNLERPEVFARVIPAAWKAAPDNAAVSSWKDMLLTKPAVKVATIVMYYVGRNGVTPRMRIGGMASNKQGVTCGDVLTEIQRLRRQTKTRNVTECMVTLQEGWIVSEEQKAKVEQKSGVYSAMMGKPESEVWWSTPA